MHLRLNTFTATAAAAGGSAAAAVTGDSLTVENGKGAVRILALWAQLQAAGFIQVNSASAHDTTRGWRARVGAANITPENPIGFDWQVRPQELLGVTIGEAGTVGDIASVCALMQYDDLPGIQGRYMTYAEVQKRVARLTTIEATITAGAGGGYTGEELITAESDLLRANSDYAVLGITCSVNCAAVTLRGPDFGNVRIGVPGDIADHDLNAQFFAVLSRAYGLPAIPIFNSGNRAQTFIGVVQNENAAAVPVTIHLGLLS
jgi:hypothetical protein